MGATGLILTPGHSHESAAQELESLRRELYQRNRLLHEAEEALRQERQKNAALERGVAELRRFLDPFYGALKHVYGEIDGMGVREVAVDDSSTSTPNARISAVWESWKSKLGGGPAKIIDALLLHREMNTQQLAIATGYHRTTIPPFIYKLNQAGLINKNGGRFSLKEL